MAYKPPTKEVSYAKYKGLAKVLVYEGKNQVALLFKAEPDNKIFVKKSSCPEDIRTGTWFVTMDEDQTEVRYIAPWVGQYKVRFKEFLKGPDDKEPTPQTKEREYEDDKGKKRSYEVTQFVAMLEVTEGDAAGLTVPLYLSYNFTDIEVDDGTAVVGYSHPKSKYTAQLMEFMEITGAWDKGAMKYQENVLPAFEKRMQKAGKEFFVVIKESKNNSPYIDTFYAPFDSDFGDDEDDVLNEVVDELIHRQPAKVIVHSEETPKKKRTAKQAIKELGFDDEEDGEALADETWAKKDEPDDDDEIDFEPEDDEVDEDNLEDEFFE